jgi:uncharacterized protein (DUF4415 family)
MKKKMVSYTPETLPRISLEETAKLVAARPRKIDTSDIPEWTAKQWKSAERGRMYRPRKCQITARLDADVLMWLKSQGKGYQSRMNEIIRRQMLVEMKAQSAR